MAFALALPGRWAHEGWKVKIRDDEPSKQPHVTLLRKRQSWRMSLRTGVFLESDPDPAQVPEELVEYVWGRRQVLRTRWNEMYPENPVFSQEDSR
jgi:2'-5' RNA ligase